jgi:hypothetical protein
VFGFRKKVFGENGKPLGSIESTLLASVRVTAPLVDSMFQRVTREEIGMPFLQSDLEVDDRIAWLAGELGSVEQQRRTLWELTGAVYFNFLGGYFEMDELRKVMDVPQFKDLTSDNAFGEAAIRMILARTQNDVSRQNACPDEHVVGINTWLVVCLARFRLLGRAATGYPK